MKWWIRCFLFFLWARRLFHSWKFGSEQVFGSEILNKFWSHSLLASSLFRQVSSSLTFKKILLQTRHINRFNAWTRNETLQVAHMLKWIWVLSDFLHPGDYATSSTQHSARRRQTQIKLNLERVFDRMSGSHIIITSSNACEKKEQEEN